MTLSSHSFSERMVTANRPNRDDLSQEGIVNVEDDSYFAQGPNSIVHLFVPNLDFKGSNSLYSVFLILPSFPWEQTQDLHVDRGPDVPRSPIDFPADWRCRSKASQD